MGPTCLLQVTTTNEKSGKKVIRIRFFQWEKGDNRKVKREKEFRDIYVQ